MDLRTHESLTTEEFLRKSNCLAAELQALGAKKDTIIGIMAENRIEYPIVILATLLTGATFTGYIPSDTIGESLEFGSIPSIFIAPYHSSNFGF